MKIATDTIRETVKYSRILTIEDGPIVSGTGKIRYRVEVVSIRWAKGEKPTETHAWGHRVLKNGDLGRQQYHHIYWLDREDCPGWLTELVKLPEVEELSPAYVLNEDYLTQMGITDGDSETEARTNARAIMNDIFANSPEFVEKMNAAVEAHQKK